MRIFRPLREKTIAALFTGQVLSSIGDEIYNVAVVWFAVTLIGEDAGYLSSLQAAAVLIFSLFGGIWVDGWNQRRLLIFSDVGRGLVVLIPVVVSQFTPITIALLLPVAFIEASFAGLFNPALRALIPDIVKDPSHLKATNALVESTVRMGRAIGPSLVAAMGKWIPPIHFFSINSLTFFGSAIALSRIPPIESPQKPMQLGRWEQVKESLLGGAKAVFKYPPLKFVAITGVLSTPTWYLCLPLAIALLVHERYPDDYQALGLVIGAYGIGNVIGNIWAGGKDMKRPDLFLSWGRLVGGIGFLFLPFVPSLYGMMGMAAIAASGGPVTDLGWISLVQDRYRGIQAARVFRFQLGYFHLLILIAYLLSPRLFEMFGVGNVIAGCGAAIAFSGVLGFFFFPKGK